MDYYKIYQKFLEYYSEYYKCLIFSDECNLKDNVSCKLFRYNYEMEFENFSKTFNYYLPFYIENYDSIINYDVDDEFLIEASKKIWSKWVPRKNPKNSGIFGELLLDFYNRIYCNNNVFVGYMIKNFYDNKEELKGIDVSGCSIDSNGSLELILSEAKFVTTLSNAKYKLIDDINGEHGHLNEQTINEYCTISLKKVPIESRERAEQVRNCLYNINRKIIREEKSFIDAMNDLGYKFKFVYFAIYQSTRKDPNKISKNYKDILKQFEETIKKTSIVNYSVEIIFIPTNNKSLELKKKMVEIYG